LWKYKGYNLKLTEKEFEKKGYNIHKRKMQHSKTKFVDDDFNLANGEVKQATRNDYEMLSIIKRDLFKKAVG
jgi:hypothetical protein